jgi:hypothetical protein
MAWRWTFGKVSGVRSVIGEQAVGTINIGLGTDAPSAEPFNRIFTGECPS